MGSLTEAFNMWLEKAKIWRESNSLDNIVEQVHSYDGLTEFLQDLHRHCHSLGSIGSMLQSLPSVGQLLGRLVSLPCLLMCASLYKALIMCLLLFYTPHPRDRVETRAKQWVLSLLKSTVSASAPDKIITAGFPHHHYYNTLLIRIRQELAAINSSSKETKETLVNIVKICLKLKLEVPVFGEILCNIVQQIVSGKFGEEVVKDVIEVIASTQRNPYTGSGCIALPADCHLAIYECHLPSLEHEIIDLVASMVNTTDPLLLIWRRMKGLVKNRHLIWCCTTSPSIFSAVIRLLRSLWYETHHSAVATVTAGIVTAVRHNCRMQLSVLSYCDPRLRPLVQLMTTPCQDLPIESVGQLVIFQRQVVKSLLEDQGHGQLSEEEKWLWVQFSDWRIMLNILPFVSHKKEVLSSCCYILAALFQGDITQTELEDLMTNLIGLSHKTLVKKQDLQCVGFAQIKTETRPLIGQIFLAFLLVVKGTDEEGLQYIFGEFCQCPSPSRRLSQLLATLDPILTACPPMKAKISPFFSHLLSRLEKQFRLGTDGAKSPQEGRASLGESKDEKGLQGPSKVGEPIDCDIDWDIEIDMDIEEDANLLASKGHSSVEREKTIDNLVNGQNCEIVGDNKQTCLLEWLSHVYCDLDDEDS